MSQGTRVLVAHYDTAQAESMRSMLAEAGAEVVVAHSGEEALAAAQSGAISLAFVSTLLPGTHGFEVCRQVSATPPSSEPGGTVPVILVTDVDDPYVRARARHVGAKQVVLEPLSAEALTSLLGVRWQDVDPLDLFEGGGASGGQPRTGLLSDLMDSGEGRESDAMGQLVDPLTGLAHESYTLMKVDDEAKRAQRYGDDLSLLLVQIDNLQAIVEQHGVELGDEAVLDIAGIFLCESRDVDIAGRTGAARFLLLMPRTDAAGAQIVAERFRESLGRRELHADGLAVALKLSVGVASLRGGGAEKLNRDLLLGRAEENRRIGCTPSA